MPVLRPDPPLVGDERSILNGFLDYYRATVELKGEVERGWFRSFAGEPTQPCYYSTDDPDGDFDNADGDPGQVAEGFAFWRGEIEHAREIVAAADLDATFTRARDGSTFSLRWILVHMIEEYARHAGHADFLR